MIFILSLPALPGACFTRQLKHVGLVARVLVVIFYTFPMPCNGVCNVRSFSEGDMQWTRFNVGLYPLLAFVACSKSVPPRGI